MTVTAVYEETKRTELKGKRNRLFQKFLNNPTDVGLALELRVIDDQLAEITGRLTLKKKSPDKVSSKPLVG